MRYEIKEAVLKLPDDSKQHSTIELFTFGEPQKPFTITIGRDYLGPFSDVEAMLKDLLEKLSRKEKKFARHEFFSFFVQNSHLQHTDRTGYCAEAAVSYSKPGQNVYQRIALITLPNRLVLAANGTSNGKLSESLHSIWKKLVHEIELK
jgi:hypothetical protein